MIHTNMRIVIVDPHVFHYKKILLKVLKREKNYLRYEALFDYLLKKEMLVILKTGKATSFRRPFLQRIFLIKVFNSLEFYLWMKINKLNKKQLRIISNLTGLESKNTIIFDLAVSWTPRKKSYLQDLEKFNGVVMVHMTHYYRNTTNLFNTIQKLKKPIIVSEGKIGNTDIFKKFHDKPIIEICLPFVIDHLKQYEECNVPIIDRQKKCLIMGSSTKLFNSWISDFTGSTFLHPDRILFRSASQGMSDFEYEPKNPLVFKPKKLSIVKYFTPKRQKTLDKLYSQFQVFFTGIEIIGIPSMNVFEGMYFGCVYIGPDDDVHKELGFKNLENYISYKPGDFDSFLGAVRFALNNPIILTEISTNGGLFLRNNFVAAKVYSDFLEKLTIT